MEGVSHVSLLQVSTYLDDYATISYTLLSYYDGSPDFVCGSVYVSFFRYRAFLIVRLALDTGLFLIN